eukprot:SAG11_NODE_30942_length_296_cov_0.781726_2_plen_20_part_01
MTDLCTRFAGLTNMMNYFGT